MHLDNIIMRDRSEPMLKLIESEKNDLRKPEKVWALVLMNQSVLRARLSQKCQTLIWEHLQADQFLLLREGM